MIFFVSLPLLLIVMPTKSLTMMDLKDSNKNIHFLNVNVRITDKRFLCVHDVLKDWNVWPSNHHQLCVS